MARSQGHHKVADQSLWGLPIFCLSIIVTRPVIRIIVQTLTWVPSGFGGGGVGGSVVSVLLGERFDQVVGGQGQITPLGLSLPICPKVFLPGRLPSSLTGRHFLFMFLKAGPACGLCGWELH